MIENILPSDTLETGFRTKANNAFDEIINNDPFIEGGLIKFPKHGGGYWTLDLGTDYFNKDEVIGQIQPLDLYATESVVGRVQRASYDEGVAGVNTTKYASPALVKEIIRNTNNLIDNYTIGVHNFEFGEARLMTSDNMEVGIGAYNASDVRTSYLNTTSGGWKFLSEQNAFTANLDFSNITSNINIDLKNLATTTLSGSWNLNGNTVTSEKSFGTLDNFNIPIIQNGNTVAVFNAKGASFPAIQEGELFEGARDFVFAGIDLAAPTKQLIKVTNAQATEYLSNYLWKVGGNALSSSQVMGSISGDFDLSVHRNGIEVGKWITGGLKVPLLNISGLTASQLVATDASKNLQSLNTATYPSLTEISYVKGVTSAIQTQINGKFTIPTGLTTNYLPKWNGSTLTNSLLYSSATGVGIGTAVPYESFEVANAATGGRVIFSDGGQANRYALLFSSPYSGQNYARILAYKYGTGAGGLNLVLNDSGGNVGIGIVAPNYKLDVNGTGHFTGAVTFDTVPSSLQDATTANHLIRYSQWIASTSVKYLPTAVKTVSLTNITLSGTQTVNGVALIAGDRILVAGQTTASANGVYDVATGAWTRSTDSDTDAELRGFIVNISGGTYAGYKYINTNTSAITVGTTSITYAEFSNLSEIDPVFTAWRDTTRSANSFWAAPNGSNGVATWRGLVAADVPILNQNTTGSAATLTTARSIAMTGDVTWSVSFNGSADVTAVGTLATISDSGTGTFLKVTRNTKGLITGTQAVAQADITGLLGANSITNTMINSLDWSKLTSVPTTLSGYGITDAQSTLNGTGYVKMTGTTVSYIDKEFVDLTTNQTNIAGVKTFTNLTYFGGGLYLKPLTAFSWSGVSIGKITRTIGGTSTDCFGIEAGDGGGFSAYYLPTIFTADKFYFNKGFVKLGGSLGIATMPSIPTERLDIDGNFKYSGTLKPSGNAPTTGQFLKATSASANEWATLITSDIPNLDASKITSGIFADARIASAATWNAKQAALVSGTNIKTVGTNSLLGSGDVPLSALNYWTKTGSNLSYTGGYTKVDELQVNAFKIQSTGLTTNSWYFINDNTSGNLSLSIGDINDEFGTAFNLNFNSTSGLSTLELNADVTISRLKDSYGSFGANKQVYSSITDGIGKWETLNASYISGFSASVVAALPVATTGQVLAFDGTNYNAMHLEIAPSFLKANHLAIGNKFNMLSHRTNVTLEDELFFKITKKGTTKSVSFGFDTTSSNGVFDVSDGSIYLNSDNLFVSSLKGGSGTSNLGVDNLTGKLVKVSSSGGGTGSQDLNSVLSFGSTAIDKPITLNSTVTGIFGSALSFTDKGNFRGRIFNDNQFVNRFIIESEYKMQLYSHTEGIELIGNSLKVSHFAGSGTKMVVTDNGGFLSLANIPSGGGSVTVEHMNLTETAALTNGAFSGQLINTFGGYMFEKSGQQVLAGMFVTANNLQINSFDGNVGASQLILQGGDSVKITNWASSNEYIELDTNELKISGQSYKLLTTDAWGGTISPINGMNALLTYNSSKNAWVMRRVYENTGSYNSGKTYLTTN